jgi:hypothetical protein
MFFHANYAKTLRVVACAAVRPSCHIGSLDQWEFQDPKLEVLYHIVGHIFWGYPLT